MDGRQPPLSCPSRDPPGGCLLILGRTSINRRTHRLRSVPIRAYRGAPASTARRGRVGVAAVGVGGVAQHARTTAEEYRLCAPAPPSRTPGTLPCPRRRQRDHSRLVRRRHVVRGAFGGEGLCLTMSHRVRRDEVLYRLARDGVGGLSGPLPLEKEDCSRTGAVADERLPSLALEQAVRGECECGTLAPPLARAFVQRATDRCAASW